MVQFLFVCCLNFKLFSVFIVVEFLFVFCLNFKCSLLM